MKNAPIANKILTFRSGYAAPVAAPISAPVAQLENLLGSKTFAVYNNFLNWAGADHIELNIVAPTLLNDESLRRFLTY